MNFKNKRTYLFLSFSLLCTILFTFPYLIRDFLPLEHDTLFHLSRIEGLAQALNHGDWFAKIYPLKNLGYGYASPLFYCDIFLIIPAILYNLGLNLASCYKLIIIISTFLSCYFIMNTIYKIFKNNSAAYLAGVLYLFNNYRITDVYVRGALGEIMGFIFLPIVLLGIYYLLYDDKTKWSTLVIGFTGLALTHNITFVLACILFIFFIIFRLKFLLNNKQRILNIIKAAAVTFLLTAFFTLPMLEQLASQKFYLGSYTSTESLYANTIPFWKYLANQTIFGYGSNDTSYDLSMLLNIGYFLMFAPLLYITKRKNINIFIKHSLLIGYILLFLPMQLLPWNYFSFFSLIQFPWRLLMISTICLLVPASLIPYEFNYKKPLVTIVLSTLLFFEGIYHILPVLDRTFGIDSKTSYENLLDGSIIDPFYSAHYVRVELAGADYLPVISPDFRGLQSVVTDDTQLSVNGEINRSYNSMTIKNIEPNKSYILPVTYYLGYQVYTIDNDDNIISAVPTYQADNSFVQFDANENETYLLKYKSTFIQNISLWISIGTLITLLIIKVRKLLHI
jgi:hypothetical protein